MINNTASYFIHIGDLQIDCSVIASNLSIGLSDAVSKKQATFIFDPKISFQKINELSVAYIGTIENTSTVLNNTFTIEKIAELRGSFVLFVLTETKLLFFISLTGHIPGYILQQENQIFITSEIKAFRNTTLFNRKMIPVESYRYTYTIAVPQTFSFLQDCNRAIPGTLYEFSLETPSIIQSTTLKEINSKTVAIDFEEAKNKLHHILSDATTTETPADKTVSLALSGGVDSGTILGLLAQRYKTVHTFSIGTEFGNEYEKAKISSELHRSMHHEIYIDDNMFCEGLLHSVFYNEICDPLYAEGFVAFYHYLKHASTYSAVCFTGYGADLILGNMHQPQNNTDIGKINAAWCRRTSWTGELSPYLAASFNSKLLYPFWNEALIDFALSLPLACIQNNTTEKIILRSMSEEKKLTHPDIAWNRKTALTHGTSIDKLFSKVLNIENENGYILKSVVLYYLYEAFFVQDKTISEINLPSLIQKSKAYVDSI
jgi:asparagine synthetase B (glutamine-hydrolysing)